MKTLKSKSNSIADAQAKIELINTRSNYPDLATGTLRYSEDAVLPDPIPVLDENGDPTGATIQPAIELTINNRVQEENLIDEIPCFDADLESDFTIESKKIISNNPDSDTAIINLKGKIKNMAADLKIGQRTSATDLEVVEILSDQNTIITAGTEIENKFCTVKTSGGDLQVNEFIEAAKIETNHTIEAAASLNDVTASNLPDLPTVGEWCEANLIYNYNGQAVHCIQGHNRTNHAPSTIPALFSVYRADTGNLNWIENELVNVGDIRFENGTEYECIQAHMTLSGWNPSSTPALWQQVQGTNISIWVQPNSTNPYMIGDRVYFPTINDSIYESTINNNVWSPAVYPAGWQLIN